MFTTPVNAGNPYSPSAADYFDGQVLSGESLMLYLSTRLSDLDDQIKELMGEANKALATKEFLNDVKEWADRYEAAMASDDEERQQRVRNEFPDAPPGMDALATKLRESHGGSAEDTKRLKAEVDTLVDEVNGQSELCMIRLQQLMSQRQVAVQLATNLLAKLNSGFEAIVVNLK